MTPYPLTITNKVLIALKPPQSVPLYIIFCRAIHDTMKNDARFAALLPKLAIFETNINTLADIELASKVRPPTSTIAERNAAKVVVKSDLDELALDVQLLANAEPTNAEVIIKAAGMNIKKSSIRPKQGYSAKDGPESGTVILTAAGAGGHAWRMSTDGISWTNLEPTSGGETLVTGLTPGHEYYFQSRRILSKGKKEEWSQIIKFRVK